MSRRFFPRLCTAMACLAVLLPPLLAGELSEVRESVRSAKAEEPAKQQDDKPKKRSRKSSRHDCDDDVDVEVSFGTFFVKSLLFVVSTPYWAPILLTDDDYAVRGAVVPAPYGDADFSLQTDEMVDELPRVFGRLQLDYGTNFGGLDRLGGTALIETPWRLGIDTTWTHWQEELDGGDDQFSLGDFNLVYRFAQAEDIQFRSGLGFNWLSDDAGAEYGFNFTYGVDYFPRQPWVISTTFDLGKLGDAGLFHNQSTIGRTVRHFEIFTGFDYYRIGGGELTGWVNGVRWRF